MITAIGQRIYSLSKALFSVKFDPACVAHGNGTDVSYADGHSARWMWKAKETVKCGEQGTINCSPATATGKNDLYKVQIGCWGKLGYTPSVPVDISED
jgi:prepilin-type processing-associated H-X9-DG protein